MRENTIVRFEKPGTVHDALRQLLRDGAQRLIRQAPSVGIYSHTRARFGISYAQPILLNERRAGAAIEGVVRDERLETTQLAVDTHGYTDAGMSLARGTCVRA